MKKRIIFFIILLLTISLSAQDSPYFTGDGGSGMRLGILELQSENLSPEQSYLPNMLQFSLGDIFTKYSAITVIDRQDLDRIIEETLDPIFTDNWDGIRPAHIPHFDTIMRGIIRKTSTGYTLQISVSSTSTGNRLASHSGNYTQQQLDDHTAIQRTARDLLTQMGITLTQNAISELEAMANRNQIIAHINLAQGVTAQRQGTEVQALSYFFQAAAIDPSLFEAVSRSDIAVQNLKTGNIGEDARNAIAWRNAWIARLRETEIYIYNLILNSNPPYTLFYVGDKLREGKINYQNETIELYVDFNICANLEWFEIVLGSICKISQAIYDGLQATGKAKEWGLDNWPNTGVTTTNPFNKDWPYNFSINMLILNKQNKIIGGFPSNFNVISRSGYANWGTSIEPKYRISLNRGTNTIRYSFIGYGRTLSSDEIKFSFPFQVKINDIEDELKICVININGIDPKESKYTIEAITREKYDYMMKYDRWLTLNQEIAEQVRIQEKKYRRGDKFTFGNFNWIVIDTNDTNILIISTETVAQQRFHRSSGNWFQSEIRSYLNSEFYNTFTKEEQQAIIDTDITISQVTLKDKIFLLSYDEALKYFMTSSDRFVLNPITNKGSWWWLRGPGGLGGKVPIVQPNYSAGAFFEPNSSSGPFGVRPAMWVNINKL